MSGISKESDREREATVSVGGWSAALTVVTFAGAWVTAQASTISGAMIGMAAISLYVVGWCAVVARQRCTPSEYGWLRSCALYGLPLAIGAALAWRMPYGEGLELGHDGAGVLAQIVPVVAVALAIDQRLLKASNIRYSLLDALGWAMTIVALIVSEAWLIASIMTNGDGHPEKATAIALVMSATTFVTSTVLPRKSYLERAKETP